MAAWLGVCVGVEVGAPRWHALTPPASQLTEIYCSFALCRVSVSSKSPPQTSNRIWLHASRSRGDNKRLMGAGSRAGAASLGRAPCFRDTHQPQKTASNQHRTLLNPFFFFPSLFFPSLAGFLSPINNKGKFLLTSISLKGCLGCAARSEPRGNQTLTNTCPNQACQHDKP